jgi:hypothetical protein
MKMKYFEIIEPYYGLIKANSEVEAQDIYNKIISDEGKVEEVDRDYALAHFSRSTGENREVITVNEILKDFNSEESLVLLVDGGLL